MTDASLVPAVLDSSGDTPRVPWPVIEACGMPEIGARLAGLSVRIDPGLQRPFALDRSTVILRPDEAVTVTGSALVLREAIELTISGAASDPGWERRIIAHATALTFGVTTLARHDEPDAVAAFSPLADQAYEILELHDRADAAAKSEELAERIASYLARRDGSEQPCPAAQITRVARALPFAIPTEALIASGGDNRQVVDWHSGVNAYGVTPSPTPWTCLFGSCTASSPTARSFDAAGELRSRLISAALRDELDEVVAAHSTVMRDILQAALGVTADVEVVFTPSGTDAELVALLVALAPGDPVHVIVVGQHEIGSGGPHAAAGRHFSERLPSGAPACVGKPIRGLDGSRIVTSTVDLRDDAGEMLTAHELEAAVEDAIAARADGYRTLVHVVEGSKTGIRLPRPETVRQWRQRYGERLDVVVDAAQMRVDQHTAVAHLGDGHMVIVTGSKFFGGPPFSGAVILPAGLTTRLSQGRELPRGMGDYLAAADVPVSLADLHAVTRPGLNAGLLLRWEAALAEIRSFHNVSPEIRDEVLRLLTSGLRDIIERTPQIGLVESPYTTIPDPDPRGLDDLPTIFTFLAYGPDGHALTMEEAKSAQRLLAQDLRGLGGSDDPVLRRTFQIGQPVKIRAQGDTWVGGLRVAIGAPTVSEIVFDHTRGRTWTERVDRTLADISDALRKLLLVLRHLDQASVMER
ncbi:hypothetical protein EF847_12785 [Actinobacteria bacterium YIM 96077]|uniref:Uncharacterized protein n=1 Tax=Phytoactinopolyspora halophila TaxID=1981511 RepID=A0A329QFU3_9ACTN|nr:hypothetical protein [Phytoactinopolyspora halophila]AYY13437.1 hypothetical protein EF847_12785 [Actinobacteria bacterium YIM 96077]RAW10831.1 hypothetical protein DPM12_18165 [Phytoactinopolyspora halophila]